MQTEVPGLPVVCSDGFKRSARNPNINEKSGTLEVKNNTTCKNSSCLVSNRKKLHPLVGRPYRESMRLYDLNESVRSTNNKNTVVQRVTSAKMLRVKQLQNQLADAHYHLNDLATENRLLKALQKRQDSALKRYEGTNAELPRIINSHHEELKVLQTKHKKLRAQHRNTCESLKQKENEIYLLQTQNTHLMQLSKDRHLEEREKLQHRVSDLTFRIEQHQETIQTLNRKLALETKSLKHQLNTEVSKHKETQKNLNEALDKLKNLEDLLDNREKRLFHSGRLPVCNKGKSMGSPTLVNLGINGLSSNPLKCKNRGQLIDLENGGLPKLTGSDLNDGKTIPNLRPDPDPQLVTETMSSLHQVRKFRLQKSYSRNGSAGLSNDLEKSDEDENSRIPNSGIRRPLFFEKLRVQQVSMNEDESDDEEVREEVEDFEISNAKTSYKLPQQLMREFAYSSSESESEEEEKITESVEFESSTLTNKSRDLHNRLISGESTIPDSITKKFSKKKSLATASESESDAETPKVKTLSITRENLSADLREESPIAEDTLSNPTIEDFLKVDINATDSDLEMERLRKMTNPQLDKTLDSLMPDNYENSQHSLKNMVKSSTELQEKIKREREISDNQLKAIDNESSTTYLLEKKLSNPIISNNLDNQLLLSSDKSEDQFEDSFDESTETQEKSNERSELVSDSKMPHYFQNGSISGSTAIGSTNDDESSTIAKESEPAMKNFDNLLSKRHRSSNLESTLTVENPPKLAIEENGISGGDLEDEKNDPSDIKIVNYNKQKLLAAMKAIDDNENIDFLANQKIRPTRSQSSITENLYRGIPTHTRKKDELLKEIFSDTKMETKLRAGCSKLH